MCICRHHLTVTVASAQACYRDRLDPTVDEVKKLCTTCRKYAKSERVLFHYNGHGVPKPTANGEIWVFNKVNFHLIIFQPDSLFIVYGSSFFIFLSNYNYYCRAIRNIYPYPSVTLILG